MQITAVSRYYVITVGTPRSRIATCPVVLRHVGLVEHPAEVAGRRMQSKTVQEPIHNRLSSSGIRELGTRSHKKKKKRFVYEIK